MRIRLWVRVRVGSDLARDLLLVSGEDDRVAHLLAARVAQHAPVDDRRLARLRVRVLGADGVDLDVGPLGLRKSRGREERDTYRIRAGAYPYEGSTHLQQLLVDVRAAVVQPQPGLVRVVLRRAVAHLPEEPLRAAALPRRGEQNGA